MSSGNELIVVASDLRARADVIKGTDWPDLPTQTTSPPCELPLALTATENVGVNYVCVTSYQLAGKAEGDRLTEALNNTATAYQTLDEQAAAAVANGTSPDPVPVPPPSTAPGPPVLPVPEPSAPAAGDGDVLTTEKLLNAGDQGASLSALADFVGKQATALETKAESFTVEALNWDGAAAEAADARFGAFQAWIRDLAATLTSLGDEARKVVDAHKAAVAAHKPIADEYKALMEEGIRTSKTGSLTASRKAEIEARFKELNAESEDVRKNYATRATIQACRPSDVPSGNPGAGSVSAGEKPLPSAQPAGPGDGGGGAGGGGGGGAGSGGGGGGGTPPTPGTSPASMPGEGQPSAPESGAGKESGAGSGGSPSGGGSPPGGGSPGGGMPDLGGSDVPEFPTDDPGVSPAAADLGGGSGGGAGGGGGGLPASPMGPAVGGVAVAPGPVGGPVAGGGGPAAGGGTGGGGAMGGGGMPMGGHGQGGGGKEKKRTPGTAPDEDLYTEDREWTEPVIGNQRRRSVQDTKDSK